MTSVFGRGLSLVTSQTTASLSWIYRTADPPLIRGRHRNIFIIRVLKVASLMVCAKETVALQQAHNANKSQGKAAKR